MKIKISNKRLSLKQNTAAHAPVHRRRLKRLGPRAQFPIGNNEPALNLEERRIPIHSGPSEPVEILLTFHCPDAETVFVSGDFNDWSPFSMPMSRREDQGHWERRLTLAPGRYEYKFVVDGEWRHDPESTERVVNWLGSFNSVLEVGV